MKLYEISNQFAELNNIEDLPEDALNDTLEALTGEFEDKGVAIIAVIKNMAGDIGQLDEAIKELSAKKKAVANRQESLKEYLRSNMDRTGLKKIGNALVKASIIKARDVVLIDDEGKLPEDYVRTVKSPDKKKLLDDLKEGFEISGATLGKGKTGLRIS